MNILTEVFLTLDSKNTGYMYIDDFNTKMKHYLENESFRNKDSLEKIAKFRDLLKPDKDGRISFNDFLDAGNNFAFNENEKLVNVSSNKEAASNAAPSDPECALFISDGDNYSTTDSGFDVESRCQQPFSDRGKNNRRMIRSMHNPETGYILNDSLHRAHHNSDADAQDSGCAGLNEFFSEFPDRNGSSPNLPQEASRSGALHSRRQSDFVTCSNHYRLSTRSGGYRNRHRDDEVTSCCGAGGSGYSPRGGSVANLYYNDSMTDIQTKLDKLQQSMTNLNLITTETKVSRHRVVGDTKFLASQLAAVEDKLRHQERQFDKDLLAERETARKNMIRLEEAKTEEVDQIQEILRVKQLELDASRREVVNISAECERLKYDRLRSEDRFGDSETQRVHLGAEMRRLRELHQREMHLAARETSPAAATTAETSSSVPANELLRQENVRLRLRLDESEARLLAISVQQGQTILAAVGNDPDLDWRSEVDGYTRDEILDLLVKEKDGNIRLREYITGILTRIIERDPTLLEIS